MSDNTFIDLVVMLYGTPTTMIGWVIIDVLAFFFLVVLIALTLIIPFLLFTRGH